MKCIFVLALLCFALPLALAQTPPLPDELRGLVRAATYSSDAEGKKLKGLRIGNIPIKDQDLAVLKHYPSVRTLDLQLLPITGKGLDHVAQLSGLTRLTIYKCFDLKDADFAVLTKLKELRVLSVSATNIGDGGLKQLATLPNLEYLNIGDTRVTEAGLSTLKKLKKLKLLVSWNPYVGAEVRKELMDAIPGIKFGSVSDMPEFLTP